MFDIGFWELALIGVVALVVVGPERLPALARTAGLWIGKARSMVADVKQDIQREIDRQDLDEVADLGKQVNQIRDEIVTPTKDLAETLNADTLAGDSVAESIAKADGVISDSKKNVEQGSKDSGPTESS
ncbi:MAG TPA: twin-arginine translocase subunit TatB [Gammaproteobacteria bacterium]|mgnify:CR=1 FL=1|nr:twin-arginine translocase subunit TatB [Gammaproteobacteria bacterium]